jgi:hypothetical protein
MFIHTELQTMTKDTICDSISLHILTIRLSL